MKKKESGISELTQIAREKRKVQILLNTLLGLSASTGVMIPIDPVYSLLKELSDQETALRQKARNDLVYPD